MNGPTRTQTSELASYLARMSDADLARYLRLARMVADYARFIHLSRQARHADCIRSAECLDAYAADVLDRFHAFGDTEPAPDTVRCIPSFTPIEESAPCVKQGPAFAPDSYEWSGPPGAPYAIKSRPKS